MWVGATGAMSLSERVSHGVGEEGWERGRAEGSKNLLSISLSCRLILNTLFMGVVVVVVVARGVRVAPTFIPKQRDKTGYTRAFIGPNTHLKQPSTHELQSKSDGTSETICPPPRSPPPAPPCTFQTSNLCVPVFCGGGISMQPKKPYGSTSPRHLHPLAHRKASTLSSSKTTVDGISLAKILSKMLSGSSSLFPAWRIVSHLRQCRPQVQR